MMKIHLVTLLIPITKFQIRSQFLIQFCLKIYLREIRHLLAGDSKFLAVSLRRSSSQKYLVLRLWTRPTLNVRILKNPFSTGKDIWVWKFTRFSNIWQFIFFNSGQVTYLFRSISKVAFFWIFTTTTWIFTNYFCM